MTSTHPTTRPWYRRLSFFEGLLAAFGLYSLVTGLWYGEIVWIFWGAMILAGLAILLLVRRRDWQQHWEEVAATGRAAPAPETRKPTPREDGKDD